MAAVEKRCDFPNCSRMSAVSKICSRCKQSRYCSVDCQKEHWPVHKISCVPASKETKPTDEKKMEAFFADVKPGEAKVLFEEHCPGITRSADPENLTRAFTKRLFPLLQQADDWSSIQVLEELLKGEALVYFVEALEKYRARHQVLTLPLPSSPLSILHFLKFNENQTQLALVLNNCLERLSREEKSSQWRTEFFHRGVPHHLLVALPDKSTSCQQKICLIFDFLFSQAKGLETDVQLGVFIMQAVDEFQEKLGALCRMGVEDMRKHQNEHLSAFRVFLEAKLPIARWPDIVMQFKILALQSLHSGDQKRFRKLVLVSEIIRQALEMGCPKLFLTIETIGFRLFLEMVDKVVTAHVLLYRLMSASKLGSFR